MKSKLRSIYEHRPKVRKSQDGKTRATVLFTVFVVIMPNDFSRSSMLILNADGSGRKPLSLTKDSDGRVDWFPRQNSSSGRHTPEVRRVLRQKEMLESY